MKILIINGSPHKGNTWKLTEVVKEQIVELDNTVEFEVVHLIEYNIPFCCGCSLCFRKGHEFCPHNQYLQIIMDKIAACDGFIVATSCFGGSATALTKNLLDHLSFMIHRPRYFDKKALVISTAGGKGAKSVTKSLASILPGLGVNKCFQLPITTFSWNDYNPSEKHINKAHNVSKEFYDDVKSGKLHSPIMWVLITFNLYRAMCDDYAPGTKYPTKDGIFWNKYQGMSYAPGITMPVQKRIFGQLFYYLGKRLSKQNVVTYKK